MERCAAGVGCTGVNAVFCVVLCVALVKSKYITAWWRNIFVLQMIVFKLKIFKLFNYPWVELMVWAGSHRTHGSKLVCDKGSRFVALHQYPNVSGRFGRTSAVDSAERQR